MVLAMSWLCAPKMPTSKNAVEIMLAEGDPLATGRDRYLAFFASAWRDLELGKAVLFNVTARQPWSRQVGLLRLEGKVVVDQHGCFNGRVWRESGEAHRAKPH
jgi:hypothetical protein